MDASQLASCAVSNWPSKYNKVRHHLPWGLVTNETVVIIYVDLENQRADFIPKALASKAFTCHREIVVRFGLCVPVICFG